MSILTRNSDSFVDAYRPDGTVHPRFPFIHNGDIIGVQLNAPWIRTSNSIRNIINLEWARVSNATGYIIQYSTHWNFENNIISVPIHSPFIINETLSNLQYDTLYVIRMMAVGDNYQYHDSVWSPTSWLRTHPKK